MKFLGCPLDRVPAVGVGADAITHRSTEEPVHRLTQRLPDDVPTRHLDHRDRRHRDLTRARVVVAVHAPDEVLDRERIAAEDVIRRRLLQVAEQRVGVIDHAHLADALQPLVGDDAHEGEVAPGGADHVRLHVHDLHRQLLRL